jgi:hypothetical protein
MERRGLGFFRLFSKSFYALDPSYIFELKLGNSCVQDHFTVIDYEE